MTSSSKSWSETLLAERAARLAQRPSLEAAVKTRRVCVCESDNALYGLPVEDISRVIDNVAPAPLANAPPSLLGIISRGGGFALVHDLAGLMGGATTERTSEGHLILTRRVRPLTVLKVTRTLAIEDIEILSAEEAASLPTRTGVSAYGRYADDHIVSIIDIAALFDTSAPASFGGQ